MKTYFQNNKKNELILFFCGWGMDEKPFSPISSDFDILYVFDYSELELNFDFSKYKKIILLAFSAGVFMADYLKNVLPLCGLKIAINGSLQLFNPKLGLPKSSVKDMENINLSNYLDFRRSLISDKNHVELFNKFQPARDFESSMNELDALKKYYSESEKLSVSERLSYDKIIIAKDDKIIPYENQLNAWGEHKNIRIVSGGHFMFYNFSNFNEIIIS